MLNVATAETSQKIKLDEREAKELFEALSSSHSGYISVNQMSDDEYTLKANIRVLGGGGFGFAIGYWGVKAIGYGIVAGAIFFSGGTGVAVLGAAGAITAGSAAAIGAAAITAGTGIGGTTYVASVEALAIWAGAVLGVATGPA